MKRSIGSILLFVLGQDKLSAGEPDKYISRTIRKRGKYATAEAGTILKPSANFIQKRMKLALKDSIVNEPAPWVFEMFTP